MRAFPLLAAVALLSLPCAFADATDAKYADLVTTYLQLKPLNDAAQVTLANSVQGLGTTHEGQGFMIGANKGAIRYRELDETKPRDLDISTHLSIETFRRDGDKFTFTAKVRAVYPRKDQLKSEYEHDEVIFAEGTLEGSVTTMGLFQKDIELANGERYTVSITMSPFTMPADWKGPTPVK